MDAPQRKTIMKTIHTQSSFDRQIKREPARTLRRRALSNLVREDALRMFGLLCLIGFQLFAMVALPPRPIMSAFVLAILLLIGVSFFADLLSAIRQRHQASMADRREDKRHGSETEPSVAGRVQ